MKYDFCRWLGKYGGKQCGQGTDERVRRGLWTRPEIRSSRLLMTAKEGKLHCWVSDSSKTELAGV
jgi:hypothetical protein